MLIMNPETGLMVFYLIGGLLLFTIGLIVYIGKPRPPHQR